MISILKVFFASFFPIENLSPIPEVDDPAIMLNINSHFTDIIVSERDVAQQMNHLKHCKNLGPTGYILDILKN